MVSVKRQRRTFSKTIAGRGSESVERQEISRVDFISFSVLFLSKSVYWWSKPIDIYWWILGAPHGILCSIARQLCYVVSARQAPFRDSPESSKKQNCRCKACEFIILLMMFWTDWTATHRLQQQTVFLVLVALALPPSSWYSSSSTIFFFFFFPFFVFIIQQEIHGHIFGFAIAAWKQTRWIQYDMTVDCKPNVR